MALQEGIHVGILEAVYHSDPCEQPSASAGILRRLLEKSPDHARHLHPKLNPQHRPSESTAAMNRGTILHALTLGTPAPFRVLDVKEFRSTADKALKADAIAAGLIPVKSADMEELRDVAAAVRNRLRAMPEVWEALQDAVTQKMTEATLIWRERGVLCRCRYDTLPAARFGITYDLKFTGISAEPDAFGKSVTGDYAFQAALYPRAVKKLRGDKPLFVFLAAETEEPYGVSLHALDPAAEAETHDEIDEALEIWANCLENSRWPSYPAAIHYHERKPWQSLRSAERRATREWLKGGD